MKRIGILTAGGDTPALNATIVGAVHRANQFRVEVFGIIKGFSGLLNPEVPHVHLNPLFHAIPELDETRGGSLLGSSRDYVDADDVENITRVDRPAPQASHRRPDLRRRRRHAQRHAGAVQLSARRARPQDDRQRPGAELPRRDQRVDPRARPPPQGLRLPEEAGPRLRPRRDDQLRDAGLRDGGLCLGPERPADPDHRREPSPDRDHRGDGPRLRHDRPGDRLRTARHHPHPRVSRRSRPPGRARALDPRHPETRRALRLGRDHRHQGADPRRRHAPARTPPATSSTPARARRSNASWSSASAMPSSPANAATRAPTPPSSPGKSATPSAAGARSSSTASSPASSAARPSNSCSTASTTACPPCNTATGASSSIASTPTSSATAGGRSMLGPSRRRSTIRSGSSPRPRGSSTSGASSATALGVDDVETIRGIFNTGNLTHPYASVNVDINKRIRRLDLA